MPDAFVRRRRGRYVHGERLRLRRRCELLLAALHLRRLPGLGPMSVAWRRVHRDVGLLLWDGM